MNERREFLRIVGSSGLLAIGCASPAHWLSWAAAQDTTPEKRSAPERVLVVVQLSGGNDGLNTVIPYEDDAYYRNRLTLAQSKDVVHRLGNGIGLHPAMGEFAKLVKEGLATIVQGVGYPQPNRSHFESMDLWHTAHRKTDQVSTGWLGRVIDERAAAVDPPALHLGSDNQPLALAAEHHDVPTLRSIDSFRLASREDQVLSDSIRELSTTRRESGDERMSRIQSSILTGAMTSRRVEAALGQYASPVDYPDSPLGSKLRSVAQLIDAGLATRIYYVTLDGFDTHSNQDEAHAGLLGQLSNALAAFVRDLKHHQHLSRVMTLVFSEFGRRVKENASRGTDHGAAAPLFLAGGNLTTDIFGAHPSLVDLDDGDLKHAIDYRSVYATLLEQWLKTNSEPVLGETFETLPLIG